MAHLCELVEELVFAEPFHVVQLAGDRADVPDFVFVLGHRHFHVFLHRRLKVRMLDAGQFLLRFAQDARHHQNEAGGGDGVVAAEADIYQLAFGQIGRRLRRRHDADADLVHAHEIGELLAMRGMVEDVERFLDHHIVRGQRLRVGQEILQARRVAHDDQPSSQCWLYGL